jgi:predicted  nucleic acid-binding Zn-ribbon protein
MDDEVHHLRRRRDELEDEELEAMEEQEPLDTQLEAFDGEAERLRSEADRLRRLLAEAESVLNDELASVQSQRSVAAQRLPSDLAQRYESLRTRLGGTGAARLVGNRCEGCHLELPAVEIDRIRHLPDDVLVTCDQCGRILIRTSGRDAVG